MVHRPLALVRHDETKLVVWPDQIYMRGLCKYLIVVDNEGEISELELLTTQPTILPGLTNSIRNKFLPKFIDRFSLPWLEVY
jgi:hypothetical protein